MKVEEGSDSEVIKGGAEMSREYSEPMNHIEFEVEPNGVRLYPSKIVTVNGVNIYNCEQVQVEQVPEATSGACRVTLVFEAVTNLWAAQREPRRVEQPEVTVLSEENTDRPARLIMGRD